MSQLQPDPGRHVPVLAQGGAGGGAALLGRGPGLQHQDCRRGLRGGRGAGRRLQEDRRHRRVREPRGHSRDQDCQVRPGEDDAG